YGYTDATVVQVGLAPKDLSLSQNYPNPFNPTTTIQFTVPTDGHVVLKVYDILGKEVATLLDEDTKAGEYQQVVFDATKLASGVYISRLEFGGKQLLRKLVLMK
ncbi:MAG TPA: T9SS type A sorting domain-containing protein, partial [Bacteroidota bacterium]